VGYPFRVTIRKHEGCLALDSEGMGGIVDIYDARENPNLASFDGLIVGSGIYMGKIDDPLEDYLTKNASSISKKIKALFVVCGRGDSPRHKDMLTYWPRPARRSPLSRRYSREGLTLKLLNAEDYKVQEDVAKRRNAAPEDYDRLQRKDCLKFGADILSAG